jgi:ADP-heptose:LPS heptosyltransferase
MSATIFFHMNQLGDLLFSLPVLSAARAEQRGEKLISYVNPGLAPILRESGLVDEIVDADAKSLVDTFSLIRNLRDIDPERAVLFSESPRALLISYFSNIKERIGFDTAGLNFLLTRKAARQGVPSLENNIRLAKAAGLKNIKADYENIIKVPAIEIDLAKAWLAGKRPMVIAPGASKRRKDKCWQTQNWKELINKLNRAFPERGIVLLGSPSESFQLREISDGLNPRPKTFIGSGGILSVAGLLSNAGLFIGIDSGLMHLAAALKTRVLVLFGPTDPLQTGPLPSSKHTVIKQDSMSEITVDEVFEQVKL